MCPALDQETRMIQIMSYSIPVFKEKNLHEVQNLKSLEPPRAYLEKRAVKAAGSWKQAFSIRGKFLIQHNLNEKYFAISLAGEAVKML